MFDICLIKSSYICITYSKFLFQVCGLGSKPVLTLGEIGFIDQSRETFSVYNTADNFSSMITLIGIEYTKYNSFTQVTLQTFVVNSVE